MDDILQCYTLLGITHTATPEEVKKAYRNLAKIWHPDRYTNNPAQKAKAEVEIKKINQAYATIKAYPRDTAGCISMWDNNSKIFKERSRIP